jgi:hypothetical protein
MLEHVMGPRWKLIENLYLVLIYAWTCDEAGWKLDLQFW